MNSGFVWWQVSAKQVLVCFALAIGMLMVPTVAMGEEEPSQDDGLQALRTANDAFDEEDFETAYEYYSKAFEILEVDMVKYRMGQTAEKIGKVKNAIEHYEAYRQIGDDEEFLSRIDDALPTLRDKLPATVAITTEPEGATVLVYDDEDTGGREAGTTPMTLEQAPGLVEIAVSLDGYEEARITKELEAGDEHSWEASMVAVDEPDTQDIDEPVAVDEPDVTAWGWTSAGIGAGVLAVGGLMSVFQASATAEVNEMDRAAAGTNASAEEINAMRDEQQALKSDAHGYHQAAMGAYIAGGLLLAAGTGILVYDRFDSDEPALSFDAGVGPQGGFLGLSGRF